MWESQVTGCQLAASNDVKLQTTAFQLTPSLSTTVVGHVGGIVVVEKLELNRLAKDQGDGQQKETANGQDGVAATAVRRFLLSFSAHLVFSGPKRTCLLYHAKAGRGEMAGTAANRGKECRLRRAESWPEGFDQGLLVLLSGEVQGFARRLHGLGKAARLGIGRRQRVENCRFPAAGKLCRPLGQCDCLGAVANRRIGIGRQDPGGIVEQIGVTRA